MIKSGRWIDAGALAFLLALVPLRTFLNETHTFETARLFRHVGAAAVGPSATFVIDGLIFLAAGLAGCNRWRRGGRGYRWTGAEPGLLLLAVAGVISCMQAGQKHLAIIGTMDFLASIAAGMTLAQVMTERWHLRLGLAAIVATGGAVALKCGWQYFVELPETLAYFEAHRAELIGGGPAAAGGRDAGMLHDFQQRMKAMSVTGFYAHPNVLASHLVLFLAAAAALAAGEWRARRMATLAGAAAVLAGCATALAGAQSKGAIAAALAGAVVAGLAAAVRGRWGTRAGATAGALAVLAGIGLLVGILNARPEALGRSMLFRWMYWQGAGRMLEDQGWLGVGANNFGRHFTRYKAVACPEEVESPHSWAVQLATEWGAAGIAGFVLVLGGAGWCLTRGSRTGEADRSGHSAAESDDAQGSPGSAVLWTAAMGALGIGGLVVLHDKATADLRAQLMMLLVLAAPLWFVLAGLFSAESLAWPRVWNGPAVALPAILGAGLIGFVLHTGIDLALFAGGPATTFFAMWAMVLASVDDGGAARQGRTSGTGGRVAAICLPIGGVAAFAISLAVLAIPAGHAGTRLNVARTACAPGKAPAGWAAFAGSAGDAAYREAMQAYQLDGTAAAELLEQLIPRVETVGQVDEAIEVARLLRQRDPHAGVGMIQTAGLYARRHDLGGDLADLRAAVDWTKRAVADYPTSPDRHLQLAAVLERYWRAADSDEARQEAVEAMRAALSLEEKRIYVSTPHRMTEQMKQGIRQRMRELDAVAP